MRIKIPHIKYIAQKIAIDLLNSGYVTLHSGLESVAKVAEDIIKNDALKERSIDEKANSLLEQSSDDMEIMQVDRKSLFWMVKKKIAKEMGFELNYEDRYAGISHDILETLWKKSLIDYNVSENKVKNIIYTSIEEYLKNYEKIEDIVFDKLDNYKRKLIPGTEEYDLIFEKLYEEELRRMGIFK